MEIVLQTVSAFVVALRSVDSCEAMGDVLGGQERFAVGAGDLVQFLGAAEEARGEDRGEGGDVDREADGLGVGDGSARCVDEDTGASVARVPTEMGTARGRSYAVPDITVCTPHHDRVTAAPVANDHAIACTSPRRIRHILPHPHLC